MNFLITAGGTREYIDSVRFISNASSGKMGLALAEAAVKGSHKVTVISTPVVPHLPRGIKNIKVQSASEMLEAVQKHFCWCDCLIMAAAVSDYTIERPAKNKIKKTGQSLTVKLKPTKDILRWAGQHKKIKNKSAKGQLVVGFALEDRELRKMAQEKLEEKRLNMIIANTPAAIGCDKAKVQIKTRGQKWLKIEQASKKIIAKKIIALIEDFEQTVK